MGCRNYNYGLIWFICSVFMEHTVLVHSGSDKQHRIHGPLVNVTKHLSFPDFSFSKNPRVLDDVKLLGSAKFSASSAIQIPDDHDPPHGNGNDIDHLRHQAGRALYSSPIRLLDPHTQSPASFQTTFSFQFHNASSSSSSSSNFSANSSDHGGSGLTFIIVPDEFTIGRPGPWLGMLNDACQDDYKAIAVEFDTRLNPEFGDPNDNHVGINLGTIVSTKTINASDVGVFLDDGSVHRVWIGYDGSRRWMEIHLGSDSGSNDSPPSKPIFSGPLDLSPFLSEYMFVGFSASTGNHTQIHSVLSWNFSSTSQAFLWTPSVETCESNIIVHGRAGTTSAEPPGTFLIFVAVLVLVLAVVLSLYYNSRRKSTEISDTSIVLPEKKQRPRPPNKPRCFTISELSLATQCFSEYEFLGSGSRGVYYRGKLMNGCQVAVKRFSSQFLHSQGFDRRRFLKEIKGISLFRHPNLVPIRGWCQDQKETMVVYEFFPNGSLDKWLFGMGVLPWTRRFKVVKDVAEAVSFLHSNQLSHKNLKTTSVFLDISFRAVLGDFGFVLCGAESKRFESAVSQSADVFEFGLFVLEVVGGRQRLEAELGQLEERDLLDFAWRMHEIDEMARVVDRRMGTVINLEQAIRVMQITLHLRSFRSNFLERFQTKNKFLNSESGIRNIRVTMSLGYAEKLSYIEDVGQVGMTEHFDPPPVLQEKIERLAMLVQKSKHLVVFTGAGISTSCGIPDFRGPKGIWTLQREGKALPEASLPFHRAMPSMTHMALVELERAGILKFVISQNVDGLHLRSGIPREKLAELHGNSFLETCPSCGVEYLRDFEVETIGLKETSRRCSDKKCGARLKDTVLDWEDALPSKEMNLAEKHCRIADVVLCLGTSLQITPACNLPLKSLRGGGKIVIVNLQKTPKDKKANLLIHGLVDKVISGVMDFLNLQIPPFVRIDFFQIILTQALSSDKKNVNWNLRVASVHGQKAPLPFIKSIEISFLENQGYKSAILQKEPFQLKRRTLQAKSFEMVMKFNFIDSCGCPSTEIIVPLNFKVSRDCFELDKDAILQKLRHTAIQESCCGQNAVVERNAMLTPKTEVIVYAIVTNVIRYKKTTEALEADSLGNGVKRRRESANGTETSRKRSKVHRRKPRF